ncbi:MAG: response regulator [Pseudobdellovibrio sp.]
MISKSKAIILAADDDQDDCQTIKEAFKESQLLNEIHFVSNGEELLNYLNRKGKFKDQKKYPFPGLILLDLKMPKIDGCEALLEIKKSPKLNHIPVVVLTTSTEEEDILRTYSLGVNSYITKPNTFDSLVQILKDIGHYWFNTVQLPAPQIIIRNEF